MNKLRHVALLLLLIGSSASSPANAAPDAAQELFDRGVAAMAAGQYEEACPSIEQSLALSPSPGTLFTLAECEAKRGRIASAVARYTEYITLYATLPAGRRIKQGDRERVARAQKEALTPRIPTLALVLPPDAPAGTVVKRDGLVVAEAALGAAFPVDPGEHAVSTQVPGASPNEIVVKVEESEKKQITLTIQGNGPEPVEPPVIAPPPAIEQLAPFVPPPDVERDAPVPIASPRRRSKKVIEANVAGSIAPSMGGDVTGGCSGTCSESVGAGVIAGGYAGYELASGFGIGVEAGYLFVEQHVHDRAVAVTPQGLPAVAGMAEDTLRLTGGMVGAAASMRLGERFPVLLRLAAGALIGHVGDARMATFGAGNGATAAPQLVDSQAASDFYAAPEVRVALPLGNRFDLEAGLRALFLVGLTTPVWGGQEARPVVLQGSGYSTYPNDALAGRVVVLVAPGIAARYAF